jgi:hypothetical protein
MLARKRRQLAWIYVIPGLVIGVPCLILAIIEERFTPIILDGAVFILCYAIIFSSALMAYWRER